jgi:hypothetical protein
MNIGNAKLRINYKDVEQGSILKKVITNSIRSFPMLLSQPIVIVQALCNAYTTSLMYRARPQHSDLFEQTYHGSTGTAGPNYITLGSCLFLRSPNPWQKT